MPLSRTARNLLFVIDAARPAVEWLGMVQGATLGDLQTLSDAGLIAAQSNAVVATAAPTAPAESAPVSGPAGELSYGQLYEQLNAQIKRHLGLIKGYHFSLEIEKASSLVDLREVAVRLVDEVQRAKGESAAQSTQIALGLAG
ncbi:MAG: hypothetical protein RBT42_05320 [Aquabacterium sp.]|uniref:hypothetical protein n=1 Tax=Aquabacterium sp. TaxID=1872578 RepID=UPI002A36AE8D|nr:hypothetical protein [Aquabacterium sp.]MDX9843158.1 hypothetical protein [Aquabacterium sp.]